MHCGFGSGYQILNKSVNSLKYWMTVILTNYFKERRSSNEF